MSWSRLVWGDKINLHMMADARSSPVWARCNARFSTSNCQEITLIKCFHTFSVICINGCTIWYKNTGKTSFWLHLAFKERCKSQWTSTSVKHPFNRHFLSYLQYRYDWRMKQVLNMGFATQKAADDYSIVNTWMKSVDLYQYLQKYHIQCSDKLFPPFWFSQFFKIFLIMNVIRSWTKT